MINAARYGLGIDLGSSSLGWALIALDPQGKPSEILAAGVRIFDAGVEGDIEQGKDSSRAVVRRLARQPRRQQWRRQHRKEKLFSLLQHFKLLPPSDGKDSASRKAVLDELDKQLGAKHLANGDHEGQQKLPYLLRDLVESQPVEPVELGRALYHLAQRRGYLSNRKGKRDDDKAGVVESSIDSLASRMNGQTLGSYFCKNVDPAKERIRRRYTARKMYWEEFDRIRQRQSGRHGLADEDWDAIRLAIFFQRPLKSQKHLIGRCELEPPGKKRKHRRCDLCLPVAQEFRILQKVNDLRVFAPGRQNEPLTDQERRQLIEALWTKPELTWSKVKTLLRLKAARFNFEEWDDKLIGHRTNAKLMEAFGEKWLEFSEERQTEIAREVLHYRKPEALKLRARNAWGLDEEAAEKLSRIHLEEDYASHSRQALRKLIDGDGAQKGMKRGVSYATVRRALYPESFAPGDALDSLPPVCKWKADIRNPAVIRALTELRKVVNEIVARYGKPATVHIELARDIRNSRQKRKDIWQKNQENQKRREKAVEAMLKECGIANPRRFQVDKWLLADECNRECPYCGKTVNMRSLMGDDAEFNVEHIFPRRYLDDSYLNKTIACRPCNDRKGDRTPAEAFSSEALKSILQRVERFQGSARDVKLARFETAVPAEDFADRQLNDTRYNSRLAAEYLGLLFGGRADAERNQRVFTPTGQLTAKVRGKWELNDLLGAPDQEKERDDHRHHAIDAIVIGLMTQQQIQRLSEIAGDSEKHHARHFFESVSWPWPQFKNDVAEAIGAINVSHRPTRTVAGPLHAESIYSKNLGTESRPEHRIRKEIGKLSVKEIEGDQIVEPSVRKAVQEKFERLGGGLPSKAFADRESHPALKTKDGREIPIHKVRIRVDAKPRSVGKGPRQRNVASGKDSNYASMVYATVDRDGAETRWEHEIITRLEAHERLSANHDRPGEKILLPSDAETRVFKFALRKNDMLEADGPDGERVLYRVQNLSQSEIQLCPHNQVSIQGKTRNPWNRITSIDNLRKYNARKVTVTPLGEVKPEV